VAINVSVFTVIRLTDNSTIGDEFELTLQSRKSRPEVGDRRWTGRCPIIKGEKSGNLDGGGCTLWSQYTWLGLFALLRASR